MDGAHDDAFSGNTVLSPGSAATPVTLELLIGYYWRNAKQIWSVQSKKPGQLLNVFPTDYYKQGLIKLLSELDGNFCVL